MNDTNNSLEIFDRAGTAAASIAANINRVMTGQERGVRMLLAAFAARGHVLLQDAPGTGKTTLAKAFALSIEAEFKRIQFTPDLLPTDITGVSIFDQKEQVFRFHPGPVFTNILLADEINRASPRTQSALLEAMAEQQVSVDGRVLKLDSPFFVIATQNPMDFHGAYPLPESQMDRFSVRFSLGYVSAEEETAILKAQKEGHPLDGLTPCASLEDGLVLCRAAAKVRIGPELKRYIVDLARTTRTAPGVKLGAGPRASLTLMRMAQALSMLDGLDFVTPEAIREAAPLVLAHRLMLDEQAKYSGQTEDGVVSEVLGSVKVPA